MTRRLNWDKAKSDKLKGGPTHDSGGRGPDEMVSEPEHQVWWGDKTAEQRADSTEALTREMAEAFARGRAETKARQKGFRDALISPEVKALLKQSAARARRREQLSQELFSKPKLKANKKKPRR
ncbi:hypothetical protein [Asticcacaulis sp. AC402]|uniref:hypothetical protein n=1 Tax=Asticcacaulis sp. AC402 TaxID=1282361 RepID=UPI0003C3DD29|nr:hypothetical protein [Asticcacaulis sp. AC402]ESQ73726.1 hypothetical protein ABAC402_17835 [Asticcacaulis sp. AC402]